MGLIPVVLLPWCRLSLLVSLLAGGLATSEGQLGLTYTSGISAPLHVASPAELSGPLHMALVFRE